MNKVFAIVAVMFCSAFAQAESPQVSCAKAAYNWSHNYNYAIELCRGADSDAPVTCAKEAYAWLHDTEEAIKLCKKTCPN